MRRPRCSARCNYNEYTTCTAFELPIGEGKPGCCIWLEEDSKDGPAAMSVCLSILQLMTDPERIYITWVPHKKLKKHEGDRQLLVCPWT